MDRKLYCAKTKSGHILVQGATLAFLETKFEFSLNDLVEAQMLKLGEALPRKLRIKTNSELYQNLYSNDKRGYYLVTIEREL
jgi:hypothetical protein